MLHHGPAVPSPDLDPEATLAASARITYLCSPNNPTGNTMSRSAIEHVVERAPGVVILDEAYAEFAGVSGVDLLERSDRLLVIRTMSKAFGLAGMRIGYAAGSPALVAEVEKSRGPYKVSALAERAAVAALAEGADGLGWVRAHVAEAVATRERFAGELAALGLAALPSNANFLLVPVRDAARIARHLREGGVAVRPFVALPGVGDALRISMGPWAMMERCLAALAGALT